MTVFNEELEMHTDPRGFILEMIPKGRVVKSVLLISGKKGAVRGQHMHKKDTHYCFVLSGKIKYTWIDPLDGVVSSTDLEPGECVFSDVGEFHKFEFLTKGSFVAMATEARTQDNYESDLTRKDF